MAHSTAVRRVTFEVAQRVIVDEGAPMMRKRRAHRLKGAALRMASMGTGEFPIDGPVFFAAHPSSDRSASLIRHGNAGIDGGNVYSYIDTATGEGVHEGHVMSERQEQQHKSHQHRHNRNSNGSHSSIPCAPLIKGISKRAQTVGNQAYSAVVKAEKELEHLVEKGVTVVRHTTPNIAKLATSALPSPPAYSTRVAPSNGDYSPSKQQSLVVKPNTSQCYIRVSDLMHSMPASVASSAKSSPLPEGMRAEPDNLWMTFGLSSPANVTAVANALYETGLKTITCDKMWIADKKTEKLLQEDMARQQNKSNQHPPEAGTPADTRVYVWTGKFAHSHFGHEIPTIRSSGIIAMSPRDLVELLLDNDRTTSYNKMSQGRFDELIFSKDLYGESAEHGKGLTKVIRSKSKPPMIKMILEFLNLSHVRYIDAKESKGHGRGYVMVTRGVSFTNELRDASASEIILNVTYIKHIEGTDNKCELINVHHICSPKVPSFIGKKIGYTAAVALFHDLRGLCA
jgi:hypothetical protein